MTATADHPAYLCQTCGIHASWQLLRRGDVVVTWACHGHVARQALRLQRAHEKTELIMTVNTTHPTPRVKVTE